MKLFQEFKRKFKPAFTGIKFGLSHRAIVIQWILALMAIIVSLLLGFNVYEMIYVVISIGLVLSIEYLNTAIEEIVNKLSPEKSEFGKITKDYAAAAVLIISIATLIGCLMIVISKW